MVLRVTLDTNTVGHRDRIEEACAGLDVELAYTTVTDRETEGTRFATNRAAVPEVGIYGESRYDSGAVYADSIPEIGGWNESRWGSFVWGASVREVLHLDETPLDVGVLADDAPPSTFEILDVVSNGSYPRGREALTRGQRRQLRDAMALQAHTRVSRDVFVSDDVKAFVNDGRRERLEDMCRTRILTVDEFCATIAELAARPAM